MDGHALPEGAPDANAVPLVRPARADEERHILGLFQDTFGQARDSGRWHWQYRDSPAGAGIVTVADAAGELLGCVTIMRQDFSYLGTRIRAGQGCDAMVASTVRGRGVFSDMAAASYAAGIAAGLQLLIAFPNANSLGPTLKQLHHVRVQVLRHYYRRLGARRLGGAGMNRLGRPLWTVPNRVALTVLRKRSGAYYRVDVSASLPDGLDPLLAKHRRLQVLSIWKDAEYLRWRYAEHPEHPYLFHVLYEGAEPLAIAVVRRTGDAASICELIEGSQEPRIAAELLRSTVAWYGRETDVQIVEFYGHDISFFDAAFQEAGFQVSSHSKFTMTARALIAGPLDALLPLAANWTISYGDIDVA